MIDRHTGELIIAIVSSLAWPAVVLAIVLILRPKKGQKP